MSDRLITSQSPYYEDAQVVIYHGDCRAILPSVVADVLVTDPPYGMAFSQGRRVGKDTGWTSRWTDVPVAGDSDTSLRDWVLVEWGARPALVFGTWKTRAPEGVREILVWDKVVSTGMGALDIPWRPSWEMVYVLGAGFVGSRGHGVLPVSLPTLAPDRQWHPTPKPVPLLTQLIEKCPPGVVIDPFMGAGSTLVAAKALGRKAIGIEVEERYCEVAARRLSQQTLGLSA